MVDARADDLDAYIAFAAAKNLRFTHVIDTHVHADHRSGGRELARRTGAQYCVHESADLMYAFTAVRDGDEIGLGNTRVKVLHTPGHSPEHDASGGTLVMSSGHCSPGSPPDLVGISVAVWLVGAITLASGVVVALRMDSVPARDQVAFAI